MIAPRTKSTLPGVVLGLAGVIVLLISICFSAAPEKGAASSTVAMPPRALTEAQAQAIIEGARGIAGDSFASSLEMKENVDFLLTPALLVQDVVSEGVVVTYPSE